jgi:hypothetical protein
MKLKFLFLFLSFCSSYATSITDIVNKSGTYNYRVAIPASPTDADDAIITISSNHVVLDLEGGCLSQETNNKVPGLNGIIVNPGLTDIEIKNGNIAGLTGCGLVVKDGCTNVRITDMHISGCFKGGISVEGNIITGTGVAGLLIDKSLITGCTGVNGSAAFGVKLVNTSEALINDCFLLHNDAGLTSSGYGLQVVGCSYIKCFDCYMDANGGYNFAAGVSVSLSTSCLFSNCIAASNVARSSDSSSFAAGFYLNTCNKVTLDHCRSSSNKNIAGKGVGFYSQFGTRNVMQYCESEGNSGATGACGFELHSSSRANLIHSESTLNETISTGTAFGILLSADNDNCDIHDNYIAYTKGANYSFGIYDEKAESTSLVIRNNAFNNGINYVVNYPSGITLPRVVGSLSNSGVGLPSGTGGLLDNIDINP